MFLRKWCILATNHFVDGFPYTLNRRTELVRRLLFFIPLRFNAQGRIVDHIFG